MMHVNLNGIPIFSSVMSTSDTSGKRQSAAAAAASGAGSDVVPQLMTTHQHENIPETHHVVQYGGE